MVSLRSGSSDQQRGVKRSGQDPLTRSHPPGISRDLAGRRVDWVTGKGLYRHIRDRVCRPSGYPDPPADLETVGAIIRESLPEPRQVVAEIPAGLEYG